MLSRWFLIFFAFVLCVSPVLNSANVPGISSTQQGVGDSNPRSIEDVNHKKQPSSKINGTLTLPNQDLEPVKEDSNNKNANVKSTSTADFAINVSENNQTSTAVVDKSHHNRSESFYSSIKTMKERLSLDNGAVKRTFYVVAGLTGIVLLYFMIKGISMKRKPRVPRYGLLAERELEAFDDGDDEDEDTTLFDAARYKKKSRGP